MSKSVLVIGELNVDLIVSGLPSLPVLGRDLICTGITRALGSSSAIFARALAGLGAWVAFMGKVGDDEDGRFMLAQLAELGIELEHVVVDPAVQTGVTISLTYAEDKAQVTYPGSIAAYGLAEVDLSALSGTGQGCGHLHMASMYLQTALRPAFPSLLGRAKAAGLTTSLDPGWDPAVRWGADLDEALAAVDILFVNEHEARAITGAASAVEGARELARRAPLVVAKLGAHGAALAAGESLVTVPPYPVRVVDTTGAGDSFDAGFIYSYVVDGRPVAQALRFANACGAIAVTRLGGASSVPTAAEVEAFLAEAGDDA